VFNYTVKDNSLISKEKIPTFLKIKDCFVKNFDNMEGETVQYYEDEEDIVEKTIKVPEEDRKGLEETVSGCIKVEMSPDGQKMFNDIKNLLSIMANPKINNEDKQIPESIQYYEEDQEEKKKDTGKLYTELEKIIKENLSEVPEEDRKGNLLNCFKEITNLYTKDKKLSPIEQKMTKNIEDMLSNVTDPKIDEKNKKNTVFDFADKMILDIKNVYSDKSEKDVSSNTISEVKVKEDKNQIKIKIFNKLNGNKVTIQL